MEKSGKGHKRRKMVCVRSMTVILSVCALCVCTAVMIEASHIDSKAGQELGTNMSKEPLKTEMLSGNEMQEIAEEPVKTVETIEVIELADIPSDSPAYDAARYVKERGKVLVALAGMKDPLAAEIFAEQPMLMVDSVAQNSHDRIQENVDHIARKYGAVGLQVAVVENGMVTDTYAYGWATKQTDPMTADHKLRVASISKVVVSMAAMILREEAAISLDADIGDYWECTVRNPYYPDIPVTIRSLLTHTSSISIAEASAAFSYADVRSKLSRGIGFSRTVPGALSSWGYNHYGFSVLGMTLELAANDNLDHILQRRLFSAMDIDASFFALQEISYPQENRYAILRKSYASAELSFFYVKFSSHICLIVTVSWSRKMEHAAPIYILL